MTLYIIITIYLMVNCFLSGIQYELSSHELTFKRVCMITGLIFFGIPIFFFTILYGILSNIGTLVDEQFQVRFWFVYHFGGYYNVDPDLLLNLNIAASKKKTNSIRDRIFRYAVSLVNKRNNYTNPNGEDEQTKVLSQ